MNATILVTDAEQRPALAIVRSLGSAGYRVFVCGARKNGIAAASRFTRAFLPVADPLVDPVQFAADLARASHETRATIVLPVTEASTLAILDNLALFEHVILPVPAGDMFQRLLNKELVIATAKELGIATPSQQILTSRSDDLRSTLSPLRYPLVIKPARSVVGGVASRRKLSVSYARSERELVDVLTALPDSAYPVMLQQQIEGPGVGVFILLWKGEVRAVFSHQRIREKPPSGGVCVYGESRAADPDLVAQSVRLLRAFDWEGVAMVEYKMESATGTPYLMEVNPRFWGSLQLAIDSGVDFPRLLVEALTRQLTAGEQAPAYREGQRTRWFWGDIDHLIARFKNPVAASSGNEGRWRARIAAAREVLLSRQRGERSEVFRWSDPIPFLAESWNWVRRRT